ncbi:MAG: preprotein translocase subunit SecA [Planctomycetota bacterium]|nr:preprotein translocase subunit SecA [Planctomycetota bacterium]
MTFLDRVTLVARRLLGTTNEAALRRLWPIVQQVRARESEMRAADDKDLRQRSAALRERMRQGARIEEVQVEALALAREVADRQLGCWTAIRDPARGFPDSAWGELLPLVEQARQRLAERDEQGQPRCRHWEIDLPAAVYQRVRELHPESVPPFRMRPHDVQILGAIVLFQGKIAEMKTGEGKTLVASLACYLAWLSGIGVHVVTVNDYLAARDAAWNEPTLRFLGMTVGAIQSQMPPSQRKQMYACDVTYGTNNEFGFDYLRDNLARAPEEQVQTRRQFAIVDEVDSVLIDEARTPLIISGPAVGRREFYLKADEVARQLVKGEHFEVDIKDRHVTLTEAGMDRAAELFGVPSMYDAEHMHLPHFLDNALKAHHLYHRDKEYLVTGGKVKIVDEHTGRILEGRRWSDGLHQAIEAKEGVAIEEENQTYATITLQNFFRLYERLAGMTGTAQTEAAEFHAIYKLEVISIPPNKPVIRVDLPDVVYGTLQEKFDAIVKEVELLHHFGQPILVGTISVEMSERLSERFTQRGIPHNVLNARHHAREAEIVREAGQFAAVTVATNMAGRGTDIMLGRASFEQALKHWQKHGLAPKKLAPDAPDFDDAIVACWHRRVLGPEAEQSKATTTAQRLQEVNRWRAQNGLPPLPLPSALRSGVDVRVLGGLRIVGTERHEARRIDNQLRGRSGRQGDPGSSRFYLSLDDDLMRRFAGPMMANLMRKLGLKDGVPIESAMVTRSIEKAQRRVEEYHYGIRKNLLEYDQVMNQQRLAVYAMRQRVLEGKDLEATLRELYRGGVDDLIQKCAADGTRGRPLAERIAQAFAAETGLPAPAIDEIPVKEGGEACLQFLFGIVERALQQRKEALGPLHDQVLRFLLLDTIDRRWKDQIYAMEHLRHGIGLEAYAQKDPRLRYKEEGFRRFEMMQELIRLDVLRLWLRLELVAEPPPPPPATPPAAPRSRPAPHDPCPCGSGQPYRRCHGKP